MVGVISVIDNLEGRVDSATISESEYKQIHELIESSLKNANVNDHKYEESAWQKVVAEIGSVEGLKEKTARSYTVLYEEDGKILGYARLERGDLEVGGQVIPNAWQPKNLYIDPSEQGKCIGRQLVGMREDKARAMGAKELYIDSWIFDRTLKFHKENGYEDLGLNRKEWLGEIFYVHVMRKPLK